MHDLKEPLIDNVTNPCHNICQSSSLWLPFYFIFMHAKRRLRWHQLLDWKCPLTKTAYMSISALLIRHAVSVDIIWFYLKVLAHKMICISQFEFNEVETIKQSLSVCRASAPVLMIEMLLLSRHTITVSTGWFLLCHVLIKRRHFSKNALL